MVFLRGGGGSWYPNAHYDYTMKRPKGNEYQKLQKRWNIYSLRHEITFGVIKKGFGAGKIFHQEFLSVMNNGIKQFLFSSQPNRYNICADDRQPCDTLGKYHFTLERHSQVFFNITTLKNLDITGRASVKKSIFW